VSRAWPALVLPLALAGCGGHGRKTSLDAGIIAPSRPVWCPASRISAGQSQPNSPTRASFDARKLLGEPAAQARARAAHLGCRWRVIEQDGQRFGLLDDASTRRVDVTVDFGVVTTVGVY
jgi:hypothetical protein